MFPLGWHNCEGVVAKYHGEIWMEGENESATEVDRYLIDQATYFIFPTIAGQWEEFWFRCVSHGMLRANLNKKLGSVERTITASMGASYMSKLTSCKS